MARRSLLGSLKKGATSASKMALKKGVKYGKKAAKKTAMKAGKMALAHGDRVANSAIRAGGVAASSLVGNPAPIIGAEVAIKGKDYLVREGAKKLMARKKSKGKSQPLQVHASYPKPPPTKMSLRSSKRVGLASQSHAYDAYSKLNQFNVNRSSTKGRNLDHFSSATRPTGSKM